MEGKSIYGKTAHTNRNGHSCKCIRMCIHIYTKSFYFLSLSIHVLLLLLHTLLFCCYHSCALQLVAPHSSHRIKLYNNSAKEWKSHPPVQTISSKPTTITFLLFCANFCSCFFFFHTIFLYSSIGFMNRFYSCIGNFFSYLFQHLNFANFHIHFTYRHFTRNLTKSRLLRPRF